MSIRNVFFDLGDTLVAGGRKSWLPGAKALLSSLKQKGFRLGIISNTGDLPTRQEILALLPNDFDIAVFESELVLFSSETGIEKPNTKAFKKAVLASKTSARSCLYCSENVVETLVAQSAGMHSVRIITGSNDLTRLESWLSEYSANS